MQEGTTHMIDTLNNTLQQGGACSAALTAEQRTQLPTRGNQGLIIHISSSDQDSKERAVAKINFLSLTDYVDPKQKTGRGAAALSSSNKSMYTLMNVVQALNSNHSFVPYRQSKVTRILQDSLCKTSGAVVIPSW
uniref:Kinesin motor domain-containing protein n=2 Tax=Aegilops tauschii subsp. strangulata TaxID=200361 RepID=A0A453B9P6_AEGTS